MKRGRHIKTYRERGGGSGRGSWGGSGGGAVANVVVQESRERFEHLYMYMCICERIMSHVYVNESSLLYMNRCAGAPRAI